MTRHREQVQPVPEPGEGKSDRECVTWEDRTENQLGNLIASLLAHGGYRGARELFFYLKSVQNIKVMKDLFESHCSQILRKPV